MDITNKWLTAYPGLAKYKRNKLYSIVGPFIMGIELIKLPRVDEYRPHFVVYSLYGLPVGTSIKDCLSYPVLMFELYSSKNLQYSLDFNSEIIEVKESLDNFLTFSLEDNISYESFLTWLDQIIDNPNLESRIKLPEIWEVRYNLALYSSNERAKEVLVEINNSIEKHDQKRIFEEYGGFSQWFKELTIRNRIEQLNLIEQNRSNKELKKLQYFEIIS